MNTVNVKRFDVLNFCGFQDSVFAKTSMLLKPRTFSPTNLRLSFRGCGNKQQNAFHWWFEIRCSHVISQTTQISINHTKCYKLEQTNALLARSNTDIKWKSYKTCINRLKASFRQWITCLHLPPTIYKNWTSRSNNLFISISLHDAATDNQ